jgi:SAM-dependent methyltransferase
MGEPGAVTPSNRGAAIARRAARIATDWIDLQWSVVVDSLKEVAPLARGRLLDVGCGDKPYEHLFSPHVTSYLGVEHESSFGTTSASGRSSTRGPDRTYSGTRLPFDDESFETVLCVQVLEHTPRPAELVAEMGRVLTKDGLLILMAPFSFRLHEEPNDFFRYTVHGLRELCGRAGLTIVEARPQGSLWTLMGHKLNTYLGLRVARMGRVAQDLGKLGHEVESTEAPRLWTLPVIAPSMACISLAARVLDRVLPDPTETLGFLVLARRTNAGAPAEG